MFNVGDIVRIKPEWSEINPAKLYVVSIVNDYTERCYITELESELPFPCTELVGFEMIAKI